MTLHPSDKIRCVNPGHSGGALERGAVYCVHHASIPTAQGEQWVFLTEDAYRTGMGWAASRFELVLAGATR